MSCPGGQWWEIYNDPQLNALEAQVDISNQNLAAAEANFRQALALIRVARAAYFPTVTGGPSWRALEIRKTSGPEAKAAGASTTGVGGTSACGRRLRRRSGSHHIGLPAELQRHLGTGPLGPGAPQRRGRQASAQSSAATLEVACA